MNDLLLAVITLAPELGRWVFGEERGKVTFTISQAAQAATGTTESAAAITALQQNATAAAQLRTALNQQAADWDRAQKADQLAQVAKLLASAVRVSPPNQPALDWAAPAISAGVLAVFTLMMTFIMVRGMPAGAETAVNLLLGTLAAMATSVVSYWVGSSAGSARKDDRLARIAQ